MSNIYYGPEEYGLEIVEALQDPRASYSFDMFVIWIKPKTGTLYYSADNGCSCPSPYEDIHSIEELTELKDMKAFENDLRSWAKPYYDAQSLQNIIDKVRVVKQFKCTILGK